MNMTDETGLLAALEKHHPAGLWQQPCGNYTLLCACDEALWGVDPSAAKAAWRLHIAEVASPTPSSAVDALREALRDVCDPITAMQRRCPDGHELNHSAVTIGRSLQFVQEIARAALTAQAHSPVGEELHYRDDQWKLRGYSSAAAYAEDMENVGRALMEAIEKDYADDPFMKNWHPADCPTEIVGDLLNALSEAQAHPPVGEMDVKS